MYFSVLDAKGIYSYANNLGTQAPAGAVLVAQNVNCDQIGNYTIRRGFEYYSDQQLTVTYGLIAKLFCYANQLFASYNGGAFAFDNGAGTWTAYSTFTMLPPTGGFLHQMLAGGNAYYTTNNGMYKLSGPATSDAVPPIPAGAPVALDTVVTVGSQINSGFLNAQSQCAYEIVWGYTDNENLQIIGAQSYPAFASNTQSAGANNNANTTVVFSIPPFVEQTKQLPWFYQIYRTPNTGSLTVPPGNNFQLVAQGSPASGDYTNNYISYADDTLDSLLGADLYSDDGQPNAGNPYNQPPLALDSAYFNSMAFYANISTLQDVFLTLDSVGATAGIQSGDTITITDSGSGDAYVYTAGASNVPSTRHFAVYSSGTPSVNIQTTAQNLVSVINQDPNNSLFIIQYISGYSGLPGQMQIFAQNLSQGFFSVISSRTTCWAPALPSSGTAYASANVTQQNYLAVSLLAMPESVPPSFLEPIGSPNFPIEKLIPVRTALIVVKPEEGVFMVTGTSPQSLTVTTLDTTAFVKGSETLVALNNAGYFFTTQGVMSVNESGCEIMSRNIQGDILALSSYSNFPTLSFGIGYQSDNAYILFCQENATDTYSTVQYRYNWITQGWTTWNIPCTAAVINTADDKLYLATPEGYILEERKTFTQLDFADETNVITIESIGTLTMTLSDSANVNVGDEIVQTNDDVTYNALVTSNDTISNVIGVSTTSGFITGSAGDTGAINSTITYMPTNCGYPAFVKKFTTFGFEFQDISFAECTASFTTDFYPNAESVTLIPTNSNTWGTFQWGTVPWGVTAPALQPITTYATKNTSIAHWINVTVSLQQAYTGFTLSGYSIFFNFLGERSR